jgi:hypothetical protein
MTGNVHHLADKVQAGLFQYGHGFGGELASIRAAQSDFCRFPNTS